MPPIKTSVGNSLVSQDEEQAVLEQMKEQVKAHAIFMTNQKGKVLFHTNRENVGKTISVFRGRSTLLFGGTSISIGDSNDEIVVRGSAPIIKETGKHEEIIGTVTVEFLKKEIDQATAHQLFKFSYNGDCRSWHGNYEYGAGVLSMIVVAYFLGKAERKRLGVIELEQPIHANQMAAALQDDTKRPKLWWFNLSLTLLLVLLLVSGKVSLTVLFVLAFCVAIIVNYPNLEQQRERIAAHSTNVLAIASMIFAAGVFTGILTGTKMVNEMAISIVSAIPEQLGGFIPVIVALTSGIFTFFMPNDAYFYGVLPILSETAAAYGVDKIENARAPIIGQPIHMLSPLVPSTHLLVELVGVSLDQQQKFGMKWAVLAVVVMTVMSVLIGAISIW